MINKKRAPIEQLRLSGKIAFDKLVERGIISKENATERIMKENPKLIFPGIPSYIPHKWTLKSAQRMMYDLLKLWQFENKKDKKKIERLNLFIKFVIVEMKKLEDKTKKKMDLTPELIKSMKSVPVIGEIFKPVNQYQTIKALTKFFVDSFATAIIVKSEASTTTEYALWFLDWTESMYKVWNKKDVIKKNKK